MLHTFYRVRGLGLKKTAAVKNNYRLYKNKNFRFRELLCNRFVTIILPQNIAQRHILDRFL